MRGNISEKRKTEHTSGRGKLQRSAFPYFCKLLVVCTAKAYVGLWELNSNLSGKFLPCFEAAIMDGNKKDDGMKVAHSFDTAESLTLWTIGSSWCSLKFRQTRDYFMHWLLARLIITVNVLQSSMQRCNVICVVWWVSCCLRQLTLFERVTKT